MMTLRQLRQIASDLGVTLYSRKSKDELVQAISSRDPGAAEPEPREISVPAGSGACLEPTDA
jgi:hypothetical protein